MDVGKFQLSVSVESWFISLSLLLYDPRYLPTDPQLLFLYYEFQYSFLKIFIIAQPNVLYKALSVTPTYPKLHLILREVLGFLQK